MRFIVPDSKRFFHECELCKIQYCPNFTPTHSLKPGFTGLKGSLRELKYCPPTDSSMDPKILIVKDKSHGLKWKKVLQEAADTEAIENYCHVGAVIGKGHFSTVH